MKKQKKQNKKLKEDKLKEEETIKVIKEPKHTKKGVQFGIAQDDSKFDISKEKKEIDEGLNRTLNDFISTVSKSKVAVIIPLYGYWNDVRNNQLNLDVLKTVLNRVYSQSHELYMILVAEERRVPSDILKYLGVHSFAGNSIGASVPRGSSYSDYVKEGIDVAIEDANARFIIVVNPWIVLQEHGIDSMVNRLNLQDAMLISGFNVANEVKPEVFDSHVYTFPHELKDINMDFMGMIRQIAELVRIDDGFLTKQYTEQDLRSSVQSRGYHVIVSQKLPIYSFDIDWSAFYREGSLQSDKAMFIKKWGFAPNI